MIIRCHALYGLMAEPKNKADRENGELSQTAISSLIDIHTLNKYNREQELQTKYIKKGLASEDTSIQLLNTLLNKDYVKNDKRITVGCLSGEPDILPDNEDYGRDVKSSWDVYTFERSKQSYRINKTINPLYYWQCQGYMLLTGRKKWYLDYCLIDTPTQLIIDEQNRLAWKMGVINRETDELFLEACLEIENTLMFSHDIPKEDRLFSIEIGRNESDIKKIISKLEKSALFYLKHFGE